MKPWVIVVVSAALGIAGGIGSAIYRIQSMPWDGTGDGGKAHLEETPPPKKPAEPPTPSGGVPEVAVDHDTHDFGVMDSNATLTHDFVFTNKGTGLLKLTKGPTTCKCAMANLDRAEVPPGKTTKVTLEWKGKGFNGPYRQTATVNTNDPKRSQVTLAVSGKVISAIKAEPAELTFTGVTAGESATGSAELFGYLAEPLKIAGHVFTDPNTAKFFEVSLQPVKPEELAKDKEAKSGVRANVTIKPGLPVGTFSQTIRFKTGLANVATFDLPVKGSVVGDLTVVGLGGTWDQEHSLLTIGTVNSREEVTRTLLVTARGQFRSQVQLKVAEVWPDLLKVEVGATRDAASQNLRQTPIVVRIPRGSPPANYLGTETAKVGRILLETSHPRAPKLLIRVRFAVEG